MNRLLVFVALVMLAGACSNPSLKEKIESQEKELLENQSGNVDKEVINQLLDNYLEYAEKHPADSLTPQYLFKAADVMMNNGMPVKSIEQIDKIMNRYPDFERVSDALFLKGFILENHLGELGRAKTVYEIFLNQYPEHEFADDVEVSLKYLGRTPEEMVREFEERNKNQR